MRQSRCNFHQNVTALSVPRSVKLAQTLVPRNQAPQLKIGESIHFDSHQAQMIQPISHPDSSTLSLGARLSVFDFLLSRLPELLLLVLSWGTVLVLGCEVQVSALI